MKDRFGNKLKVGDKVHFLGGPSGYGDGIYLGTIVDLKKDRNHHRDGVIMECEEGVYPNSHIETCSRHPYDVAKAYVGKRKSNKEK
jgi:hypothetical protein